MDQKTKKEEEFFARQEIEKKRAYADKIKSELVTQEREQLKNLHWMRCPKCGMELNTVLFRGVNIDKCFGCNGVFLDNGELEELAGKESTILRDILGIFKSN